MTALITAPDRVFEISRKRSHSMAALTRSFMIADSSRRFELTATGRSFSVYAPSPTIAPEGVLLDDEGFPLKDDDGNFLIQDD